MSHYETGSWYTRVHALYTTYARSRSLYTPLTWSKSMATVFRVDWYAVGG